MMDTYMAEQAMSKALMQLMRMKNQVYISCVLLNLKRTFSMDIETAGVNGIEIKVNPDFFLSLSEPKRRFLLVHEAWHIGLFDVARGKDKNPAIWNMACDHYINLMIANQNDSTLEFIGGGLKDIKYFGWEKEDIYQDLLKNAPEDTNPIAGDLLDSEGTEEEVEKQIKQVTTIVQQAAMQAHVAGGEIPKQVNTYLKELYCPKLPIDQVLLRHLSSLCQDDYSYRRINKSFFTQGWILPTLYSEGLGRIAIANDSSCSVGQQEFRVYLGAIKSIRERFNPERMDVVNFTTRIEDAWTLLRDDDDSVIKCRSQGGTDLRPVFDHFNKPENRPEVLIVFSDLECTPITEKPNYDVVWVVVNNPTAQVHFGTKIHVQVGNGKVTCI